MGCRLEHSRQWALRCYHEASAFDENCFITLTYSPENLPPGGSLDPAHPVAFMKRLREKHGKGIRSYGCAEYGEKLGRPHYHLCLFNFDWKDKKLAYERNGFKLYDSEDLERLWGLGHCKTAEFSFETAAYVARYITKKMHGKNYKDAQGNTIQIEDRVSSHYTKMNEETGEYLRIMPERPVCVSRRPGIGRTWWDLHHERLQTQDTVILRNKEVRPPKYYDYLLEKLNPNSLHSIKQIRKQNGLKQLSKIQSENQQNYLNWKQNGGHLSDLPQLRQDVTDEVLKLKMEMNPRKFENGKN